MLTTSHPLPEGWTFNSADFSIRAGGRATTGLVMLVRTPEQKARWHLLPDALKEAEDGPPLFISGTGRTLEEALANAAHNAERALPIPCTEPEIQS